MKIADRVLAALLVVAALVTGYYWWSYFVGGGDVMVTNARWYTAFESAFPIADGWMAICAALAGIGLWLGRPSGPRFGLMAASAILYLAAMDITFDIENGMYALTSGNDAMKFEVFINITCLILGVWTLIVSWRRSA